MDSLRSSLFKLITKSKKKPILKKIYTEEEYVSLYDMINDILFVKGILEFLKILLQFPIKTHVDNKGSIITSPNPNIERTSKLDIIY